MGVISWIRIGLTGAAIAVSLTSVATAQMPPPYGYTFFDQAYAGGSNPDNDWLNVEGLAFKNSIKTSGVVGASAFSGKLVDAVLEASSATSNTSSGGEAYSNGDIYTFDTFTINGPQQQSGTFTFTLKANGSIQEAGTGQADLICTYTLFMNGTVIPGIEYMGAVGQNIVFTPTSPTSQTVSFPLQLSSGEMVVFGGLLQIRNVEISGDGNLQGGSTAISVKKAHFSVKSPKGFSFTTASGLQYR